MAFSMTKFTWVPNAGTVLSLSGVYVFTTILCLQNNKSTPNMHICQLL